ncbi:MAG: NADH-quinone oxidoreductase subunit J [Armatimonadota bacterium]|nr:NADH-quinone oxidoreductase subunit J [Armatimonadota bacterium]MDR7438814.1 NADH-quinone oxidoreductase subunit J [Armatimonadota bacterium]MDR7562090.1 NADH-quinone oxidoreductase subunit J [Armatimonadota bacterium]MDR7567890.1 NADH-quinone oxidoreductase subunit J [Armatimonadota bacterium]MDR7601936.1 NADH-quinone oxidoreductase subunit J [Armatimonadota bacterium]
MESVLFVVAAALSLAGGVGVVAARAPVHSALSLLVVLVSLAVLYLTLLAEFVAVLQVIVYAGAILVLFLFVIMLLHAHNPDLRPSPGPGRLHGAVAIASGGALVALVAFAVLRELGRGTAEVPVAAGFGTAPAIGRELLTTFVLPFELAGVLLLVGMVAGIVLGKAPERRVSERTEARREEVLLTRGRR